MRDALMGNVDQTPSWQSEKRERPRYSSPIPRRRRDLASGSRPQGSPPDGTTPLPRHAQGPFELEPPHLASLTTEQRADLRLWHGRVNLLDRVRSLRRFGLATVAMCGVGLAGFIFGVAEVPPLVVTPIVPIYMTRTLWKRGKSLRREGLKLRRVFLARRSSSVVEAAPLPTSRQLRKLAPREVLASAYGSAIRRAAEERVAILGIVKALGKADRALLPEVVPTVHGLVDRVANLAKALHRLDAEYDPSQIPGLDERIASAERAPDTTDALRHLALLRRQRVAMEHFGRQRGTLLRQLESAGLALSNLRLDLVKLRTSGLEAGLEDLTSATQEARVLSRDIGMALEAVVEVRRI
jgi:hypothetical protein